MITGLWNFGNKDDHARRNSQKSIRQAPINYAVVERFRTRELADEAWAREVMGSHVRYDLIRRRR